MLTKIISQLYGDFSLKFQVLFVLYSQCIQRAIRLNHKRRIGKIYKSIVGFVPQDKTIQRCFTSPIDWIWRDLPDFWLLRWWERFETVYLVWILIKNIINSSWVENQLKQNGLLEQPTAAPRCYLLGRLYMSDVQLLDETICNWACLIKTCWRMTQYSHKQKMTLHYFLLFSQENLQNYYRDYVIGEYKGHYLVRSKRASGSHLEEALVSGFFHDTMSYKVSSTDMRYAYRLRPNRTQKSYRVLRKRFIDLFLLIGISSVMFVLVISPFALMRFVSKQHYEIYFHGCGMEMYWVRASSWPLLPEVNWYRLIMFSWDIVENIVLWIESSTAGYYGLHLLVMVHFDIQIYLQDLHRKVADCYKILLSKQERLTIKRSNSDCNDKIVTSNTKGSHLDSEIDEMIYELQFQLHDLFKQIKRSNSYISDALSIITVLWLTVFLVYAYVSINGMAYTPGVQSDSLKQQNMSPYIMLVVLIPMVYILFLGWYLLSIHRQCLCMYQLLCPILAMYRSDRKLTLLPVLDYFKDRRTCYTIFRISPFLPTTFLSIFGWTFSCFFILRSLFDRNRDCLMLIEK